MNKKKLVIYWSRRDFRLRDNSALSTALRLYKESKGSSSVYFLPVFIVEPYMVKADPTYQWGVPSRYALAHMVPAFAENFSKFYIVQNHPTKFFKDIVEAVSDEYDIELFVNEDVHPDFYTQLRSIKKLGYLIHLCRDQLTVDRNTKTGAGKSYSIFTPFKKAVWLSFVQEKEVELVSKKHLQDDSVSYFNLKQKIEYAQDNVSKAMASIFTQKELEKESIVVDGQVIDIKDLELPVRDLSQWYMCEHDALLHFNTYMKEHLSLYKTDRDSLENDTTSKMSPALTWGLVSARTMIVLMRDHFNDTFENPFSSRSSEGALHYISELIWREFYKYLYLHNPHLINQEFQEKFRGTIEWLPKKQALEFFIAWIKGETGYKIVDAAMMQLAQMGWMHNRARMIVASVLTKNLGVDWRWGQEYFRAMLIDIDEASNTGGWQWGASVGADPKPIRIFNPYLQAESHDPKGVYQKRWLGEDRYKKDDTPIVTHEEARTRALKRYGLSHTE